MYASKRYIEEFQKDYPEIAEQYYDIRYEDLNLYNSKSEGACWKSLRCI